MGTPAATASRRPRRSRGEIALDHKPKKIRFLALGQFQDLIPSFPNRLLTPNDPLASWGFAAPRYVGQRSDQDRPSEEFADMYLGWVYGDRPVPII